MWKPFADEGVCEPCDLTVIHTGISITVMTSTRRVTANLPEELLGEAMRVTGKGITDTLVEALEQVRRSGAYEKALALKGRLRLDIDLEHSRERRR